jgi:hypothetical protein
MNFDHLVMNNAFKVAFDKNVYEFVVEPTKVANISFIERRAYQQIHSAIQEGKILPFISETILTYETLAKKDRFRVLSHEKPISVSSDGDKVSISSNVDLHSGSHDKDLYYLTKAIELGFKILPGKRFGKLINPIVCSDWYYITGEDYFEIAERFAAVTNEIENLGGGYRRFQLEIGADVHQHLNRIELFKLYKGSEKKLSKAIAEWSDGDSVALHIAYGLDYFCTHDRGKNAGKNSVFSDSIYSHIRNKFGFTKLSPAELISRSL